MKNSHRELSNLKAAIAADVQAAMDHSQNTPDRLDLLSLPLVDSASWARANNIQRKSGSNTGATAASAQNGECAFREPWNDRP